MQQWNNVNPSGGEIGIFQENLANIMAADALAPHAAKPSSAMVLAAYDKGAYIWYVPWEMMLRTCTIIVWKNNANILLCFLKTIQHVKG